MASFKEINTESSLNLMGEEELDQEFEKLFNKKGLADPLTTDTMARPSSKLEIPEEFEDFTMKDAYLNNNNNDVKRTVGSAQDEELQRMEQQWINELQESIQLSMLVDDHGSIQYKSKEPSQPDRNYAPQQQQQQLDINPFRELQEDKCDFEKSIMTISDRHTPESPEHKPLLIDASTLQAVEHFRRSTDENINHEVQKLRERIKELENMAELNETVQNSKEYFGLHRDDDYHLLKHDEQTQTSNDHEESSQYRRNMPATKESESIELIKLRNQITSLESKLSVLERRVEYYEFVAKTAEEERDKLLEKLKRFERAPVDKTSPAKSNKPKEPHVVNDLAEVSMVKASPEKGKSSTKHDNIIDELSKENESTQAWKSTGAKRIIVNGKSPLIPAQRQSLKEIWKNGSKKEEIKRQLKKSIVASRHTSRSPSRFDVQVEKPPFLVGTSITPSFNLNANIQQIKALLKQHDPAVCDICNSAQRISRTSRRSLGQPQIHHWTNEELRLILEELEAEYRHFSYNYSVLVKTNASGKDIKAMKQNMEYLKNEIERIRSILGPNLDHLQPRQPSKAFISLCKLRSTQKLREALLKEESLEHARVFGGSSPLRRY